MSRSHGISLGEECPYVVTLVRYHEGQPYLVGYVGVKLSPNGRRNLTMVATASRAKTYRLESTAYVENVAFDTGGDEMNCRTATTSEWLAIRKHRLREWAAQEFKLKRNTPYVIVADLLEEQGMELEAQLLRRKA